MQNIIIGITFYSLIEPNVEQFFFFEGGKLH